MSSDVAMPDVKVPVKPINKNADVKLSIKPDVNMSILPSQIRGPISLVEYRSLTFNKHVYVFGEVHGGEPRCVTKDATINVEDFIADTINISSPHVVDVYLEKSRDFSLEDFREEQYLDRIYKKLYPCLRGRHSQGDQKQNCPYPNLRFHAVDIRDTENSTSSIVFLTEIYDAISHLLKARDKESIIDGVQTIARSISMLFGDLKEDKKVDYEPFLEDEQLRKQLQAVDKGVLSTLMLHLNTHTNLTNAEMRDLKEMCEIIVRRGADDLTLKGFLPAIADIHQEILGFLSLFVDIYTMARIFRSFRKVPGQYSGDPQRIIIYLGDFHAISCREILRVLGFTLVSQTYAQIQDYPKETPSVNGVSAQSCVDISSFAQPFFTGH